MKSDKSIKISYSFLKVLTASDLSRRRLPLMAAESINPGPVVWLTGCIHGDEVSGIVIIQEIFKIIKRRLLKGKIFAFPLINPTGFEHSSRFITLSEEDLNRSFPGKKEGSLSERIADQVFTAIIEKKPNLVLDLHNDWIKSMPYTLIDHNEAIVNTETYEKVRALGKQTGLVSVIDSEELEGTLSYNLIKKGIAALTLELGEPYIINEKSIEISVSSILNILRHLGMIEGGEFFVHPAAQQLSDRLLKYVYQNSSTSGVVRFYAKPGDMAKRGQPVARIYNAFGKLQETIVAQSDGVVLGHSDYSAAFPGSPVISFGVF